MHALIATDGSEVSLDAARRAVALLAPTKVTLLTVADTAVAEDSGAGGFESNLMSPEESAQARLEILDEGRDELSDTIEKIGVDPSIVERRLEEGAAGATVCAVAAEISPDVVVVGSHGRGFFKRIVIGSVSEYVTRHCEAPVLVIRHGDHAPTE
jgi:nucleotide-binding universal stress UspA family protein